MVFGALYFMAVFLGLGIGAFYIIERQGWGDPLLVVNQFLIYYLVGRSLHKVYAAKNADYQYKALALPSY